MKHIPSGIFLHDHFAEAHMWTTLFVIAAIVGLGIWMALQHDKKLAAMTPEQRAAHKEYVNDQMAAVAWGQKNYQIVCPQCQTRGNVYVKRIKQKKGISGGKATGALLTGGVSLLATGLSRKEASTEARCTNCDSTWHF